MLNQNAWNLKYFCFELLLPLLGCLEGKSPARGTWAVMKNQVIWPIRTWGSEGPILLNSGGFFHYNLYIFILKTADIRIYLMTNQQHHWFYYCPPITNSFLLILLRLSQEWEGFMITFSVSAWKTKGIYTSGINM